MSDDDNLSLNIKNTDEITNQLNAKLKGRNIRVLNAFFRNHVISKRDHHMTCESPLSGNVLQMNFVTFYPDQCTSGETNTCKSQFIKELQDAFNTLADIPMDVEFKDDRSANIRIKICGLAEKTEQQELALKRARKVKKYPTLTSLVPENDRANFPANVETPRVALKYSRCTQSIGRILLVQLTGEHGSTIQDDLRTNGYQYQQQPTISLYEDTNYRLHIEFDCSQARNRYPSDNNCELSQDVNVWINFDGDNSYGSKTLISPRSRPNNYVSGNSYNLDIRIPSIDGRAIRSGQYRMQIAAAPTEAYLSACGTADFESTREYTVNVIPKSTYTAAVRAPPANIQYVDPICSQNTAKISLVLMAGERGSEIRDDLPSSTLLNDYYNRHHLAVTLYEHTVYLIRIQLDCAWQLNTELFENGCNLAQDVNVWIDVNDDGRFDQTEIGAPYRWPVTSYMAQGIYDMQISVPLIDERYTKSGQHRMRVVVTHTDHYRRVCGRNDYNETREYTMNVISRGGYLTAADTATPYIPLSDIACSAHLGKIVLVVMAGEHRTQIRDDSVVRSSLTTSNRYRQSEAIVLFEDTVYLLRIQLDCSRLWVSNSNGYSCSLVYDVDAWIDLNDDGVFDKSENAVPYRWPLTSYTPQGVYDLQLYVPVLDTQRIKRGPHRLQLAVAMNDQYRKKCGNDDYKEIREYTVSIVPNTRITTHDNIPHLVLSDNVCSQKNGKIALVLMAGEQGTHIRDNIATNNILPEDQNRHHLAVSVYEGTMYRIRIQLDCFPHWKGGYPDPGCNVAQDVNVLIDFNNDDRFDESESRVPHRWPLLSSMPLGIYDLDIEIPGVNGHNIKSGSHRLRVVATPSDEYTRKCGKTDYRETRDYTITILSKTAHRELEYQYAPPPRSIEPISYGVSYCPAGNLICSPDHNTITFVNLYGDQGTQIRDDFSQCNSANNYNDRTHLQATLMEDATYSLRIQLHCSSQFDDRDAYGQHPACNHPQYVGIWIDLNNDGVFDENEERIRPRNRYEDGQFVTHYDLSIAVSRTDGRSHLSEQHRMRIVLAQDERSRKPCHSDGYGEVRDYTVQIIPKFDYHNTI